MSASYYETCKSCKHVFKPKKMNKLLLEKRICCICNCHWNEGNGAIGITVDEAIKMIPTLATRCDPHV